MKMKRSHSATVLTRSFQCRDGLVPKTEIVERELDDDLREPTANVVVLFDGQTGDQCLCIPFLDIRRVNVAAGGLAREDPKPFIIAKKHGRKLVARAVVFE